MIDHGPVWVKVCGITRSQDLEAAEEAGADAVGLVVVPESPRALDLDRASELARAATITTFLLTRDLAPEVLVAAAITVGVDGVQPYGLRAADAARAAREAGLLVLRPLSPAADLSAIPEDELPLFDHVGSGRLGGTGSVFDHSLLPRTSRRFVLAGGLDPVNVGPAVRMVKPWGVDASTGLESAPGVKDPERVTRFVRQAKAS